MEQIKIKFTSIETFFSEKTTYPKTLHNVLCKEDASTGNFIRFNYRDLEGYLKDIKVNISCKMIKEKV